MGCATDKLPFLYLGMPLGAKSNCKHIWDPVIEKFDARLSTWRQIKLSKGGKLTLLKCILSALPMYYFSLFRAPVSVINELEKKMRKFLWEYSDGSKTSHLVRWELVCAPKDKGGLGVCNLRIMNQTMLAKWCWRFGVEKNKLWCKIIMDKYGSEFSHWTPEPVTDTYGVSCWRTIADNAHLINSNSNYIIHSGNLVSFWHDIWTGNATLSSLFKGLHKLVRNKNSKVADMINSGSWRFDFKRHLTSDEANMFANLLLIIGDAPPVLDTISDTRRWSLHNTGVFTVKSLYSKLVEEDGVPDFPNAFIWKPAIPPKISFHMWCLLHGKLNTIDVLQRKSVDLYNSCIMCGDAMESHNHLFLHCKVAHFVWSMVLPSSCWSWVTPSSFLSLANCWNHSHFSNSGNYIWDLIPAAVVWTIWTERNCRSFEEKYTFKTDIELGTKARSLVLSWASAAGKRVHLNFASSVLDNWDASFM